MASRRKPSRKIRKSTIIAEVTYPGKYVFIKELNMNIKLHKGSSIKDWIKKYCKYNMHLIPLLYPAYNIK